MSGFFAGMLSNYFVLYRMFIRKNNMKKMSLIVSLLLWLPLVVIAHTPQLIPLLIYPGLQTQDKLTFVLTGDHPAAISELRIHFLSGEDCYSGYLQGYRSTQEVTPFLLTKDQPFALTGEGIYQIAQTLLDSEALVNIHAILIRFLDREQGQSYQHFARFTGSCQDQEINCCIPVDCSSSAGVCVAKHDLGIQPISWDIS